MPLIIAFILFLVLPSIVWSEAEVHPLAESITQYHEGIPDNGRRLRVVYFHANDREPLEDYQGRMHRIMEDIQSFYREGMTANGFDGWEFRLERDDDNKLNLWTVRGKHPAKHYDYDSGDPIFTEIKKALGKEIDFDNEHVIVLHGLCEEREDGSFSFHAPYYGASWSNHVKGLCHAADCRLQDPLLLKATDRKIVYEEHYGEYLQSLAEFNTKYLGGIAHELGHGFSLPHNGQTHQQRQSVGTALMGSGNHTYRREVRGKLGSFMTEATAVRLAVHLLCVPSMGTL